MTESVNKNKGHMADYISKQTIMNAFAEYVKRSNNSDFAPTPTWNDAVEIVENLPTVDAVQPVVRCTYCKHSTEWYGDKRRCFLWCETGIDVFEDGYCNYWEKKDD